MCAGFSLGDWHEQRHMWAMQNIALTMQDRSEPEILGRLVRFFSLLCRLMQMTSLPTSCMNTVAKDYLVTVEDPANGLRRDRGGGGLSPPSCDTPLCSHATPASITESYDGKGWVGGPKTTHLSKGRATSSSGSSHPWSAVFLCPPHTHT